MRHSLTKRTLTLFAAVMMLILLITAPAITAVAKTSGNIQHIYDKAGLLSSSESENLESMCAEYSVKDDIDIIILTHDDPNAVDGEVYIENFIDKMQYLDSVIILVDMHNRDVVVEGYGIAQKEINPSRAQAIADKVSTYLSAGNYADAFEKYILSADKYMNYVPVYFNPFAQIAVALIIGVITVAIMAYNAGGKMTVNGATYIDGNHSGLIGRRDDYIRTQITRIPKPKNNGGGGGGISAGGLSHSTGRAKF